MTLSIGTTYTNSSATPAATLALSGVTAAVRTLLQLVILADNSGASGTDPISTPTDSAGNTWTKRGSTILNSPVSTANDGTAMEIWECTVAYALSSGTVTCNFSPSTNSRCAILGIIQTDDPTKVPKFKSVGAGATGSNTAASITSDSLSSGNLIVGLIGVEGTGADLGAIDSDTTNGSWSAGTSVVAAAGGGILASQALARQYKAVTGSGTQTYNRTLANSREWVAQWISYEEVAFSVVQFALTDTPDVVAFEIFPVRVLSFGVIDTPDTASFELSAPKLRLVLIPDSAGYVMNDPAETVRTQLDGGASRFRKDITKTSKTIQCTFNCSRHEYDYLRAFYRHMVRNASNGFFAQLIIDESDLTTHRCYFVPDTFSLSSQIGQSYTVQVQLEARPLEYDATIDESLIAAAQEYGPDFWNNYESILDEIINEEFPEDMD